MASSLAPARRVAQRWRERFAQSHPHEEQRSLFGEILDWMFSPMVLLWPLTVLLILPLARTLADAPFDRALYERTEGLVRQVQQMAPRGSLTPPRSTCRLYTYDPAEELTCLRLSAFRYIKEHTLLQLHR